MRVLAPFRSIRAQVLTITAVVACATATATGSTLAITARSWVYEDAQQFVFESFRRDMQRAQQERTITVIPSSYLVTINGALTNSGSGDLAEVPESMQRKLATTPDIYAFARLPGHRVVVGYSLQPAKFANTDTAVVVYTVQELTGVPQRLQQLTAIIAMAAAGSALLGALLGYAATSSLTRPLRRIETAALQVSNGDQSASVPVSALAELHNLTNYFNTMLDRQSAVISALREQDERARRFVSDVSHELRSPLAALVPAAEVLREELAATPGVSGRASRLLSSQITALTQLVEDLLEMTRLDAGIAQVLREPIDLVAITQTAVAQRNWEEMIQLHAPTQAHVLSDRRRVTAIVTNLIGNALQHGAPPVTAHIAVNNTQAVVQIRDHGPGIPPHLKDRVFERTYKVADARTRHGGAGLGLAIARENARLLGGDVTYTRANHLTVFTATLPVNFAS